MSPEELALVVQRAAYDVESKHHFHNVTCLCGYSSHRSRDRTEHLTQQIVAETNAALRKDAS